MKWPPTGKTMERRGKKRQCSKWQGESLRHFRVTGKLHVSAPNATSKTWVVLQTTDRHVEPRAPAGEKDRADTHSPTADPEKYTLSDAFTCNQSATRARRAAGTPRQASPDIQDTGQQRPAPSKAGRQLKTLVTSSPVECMVVYG